MLIECTDLFSGSEWAQAHVDQYGGNIMRINVQMGNAIKTIHIRIDKLASFLEDIRRVQDETKQVIPDTSPKQVETEQTS